MANYIKRFLFVDEDEKERINILFYPFIWATFFYGLGFAVLGWWSGVSSSSLYKALYVVHPALPPIWGLCALAASMLALSLILTRRRNWLGNTASMFGFLVWTFAAIIYAMNGFWLVFVTVSMPNTFFWAWYYTRVMWYAREKEAGRIRDPR